MKKLLWSGLTVCLLFLFSGTTLAASSVAATATFTYNKGFPVSIAVTSTTTATINLTLPANSMGTDVCVLTDSSGGGCPNSTFFYKHITSNDATPITATVTNLDPTKTYYVVVQLGSSAVAGGSIFFSNYQFLTGAQNFTGITLAPTSQKSGSNVIVSANIDPTKYPSYATLSPSLIYSKDPTLASPINGGAISGRISNDPSAVTGVSTSSGDAGTSYWVLTHLDPSTQYSYQVTFTSASGQKITSLINSFNSDQGVTIAPGSAAAQANLNAKSYTLISKGFPGLSVIPDPATCATETAAAQKAGTAAPVCDINGLLNYALKLLIGISGVVLVFRLMYEGFIIMTSDVPFKISASKSGFFTALGGLLLALTSYIILNTINPQLVNESIGVTQLSIGVDETSLDSQTFQNVTGETLKTKSAYLPLAQSTAQKYGIDPCVVEAAIQQESDWNAGAIGCDEDVPSAGIPSRAAFIQSGVTYGGTTFTNTDVTSSQKDGACKFNPSVPGYGLDWRFSKGGGLMQITIFPQGYKSQAWYAGVKSGGSYWNSRTTPYPGWQTLIKPETNVDKGTQMLKQDLAACGGNVQQAFTMYNTGSCTSQSAFAVSTAAQKMSIYNSCKSNGSA